MPGWLQRTAERLVGWLVTWNMPLLIGAVLVGLLAYFPASQMRFDRSIERMFAPNDPLLPPYERLKSQFGGNEVVLAVYADPQLLTPDGSGLKRLAALSSRMKKVPGVKDVLSLAEVNGLLENLQTAQNFGGVLDFTKPAASEPVWKGPAILNPHSELSRRYRLLFQGYTHGVDGQTAALACMLDPAVTHAATTTSGSNPLMQHDPREQTIAQLREIVEALPDGLAPGVLAGEPVMVVEGFKLLEQDGQRLGIWSTILLGITIVVCFRSFRWLLVPVAVVQWTLLATQGLLAISGLKLTMVSSMLTAIITVVGVATVIHLIVRFRELRREGLSPTASLSQSLLLLGGPIIGACLTDAAGFGSLWFASVGPVKDFGTMMVVGSLLVLVATALLVPGITLWGSQNEAVAELTWGERWIRDQLARLIAGVQARPWLTAILSILLTIVATYGSWGLEVETDFTRNFRPGSRLVNWYEFVETKLGGAGVWDVIVPAPRNLTENYLVRVRKLEEQLAQIEVLDAQGKKQPGLTKIISLVDALDAAQGDAALAALPIELRARGMASAMPVFMGALRSLPADENSPSCLRIMLRARERQPASQKQRLIAEVTRLTREAFPTEEFGSQAEVTGFFVLLTNLIESMLRDQWVTFAVATGGIFLMLLVAFRSPVLAGIALVPNALPILMVMGLLGWAGLKINMGSAMIAAVSMGLSVDSSIHYLALFQRLRKQGKTVREALGQVQESVGLAMVFSTVALVVGFLVLMTSEFVPTIYFGALVSLAMLGGLAGNLVVLPLLLGWLVKDSPKAKN